MHAKKKKFSKHFKTADIAVFLGIMAFLWMSFSLLSNFRAFISNPASHGALLTLFHAAIGFPALFGGTAFASKRFIKKTVIPMRVVFLLWAFALFLGMTLYAIYYMF